MDAGNSRRARLYIRLSIGMLVILLSTSSGCGYLNPTHGLEGLMGPYFGCAVHLVGSMALIGADGGAGGSSPGLAYVFERTAAGWTQGAALSAVAGKPFNDFGKAVALSGTTALVGASHTDGIAPVSGAAYIFERGAGGWAQSKVLINPDTGERHILGRSVALFEGTAVVGAPGAYGFSGAFFVWQKGGEGWRYQQRILPDSSLAHHQFGENVAMDQDLIAVGAHLGTTSPGAIYLFRHEGDTWRQEVRLAEQFNSFGTTLGVSNGTVAVGAQGAVFMYEHSGGEW